MGEGRETKYISFLLLLLPRSLPSLVLRAVTDGEAFVSLKGGGGGNRKKPHALLLFFLFLLLFQMQSRQIHAHLPCSHGTWKKGKEVFFSFHHFSLGASASSSFFCLLATRLPQSTANFVRDTLFRDSHLPPPLCLGSRTRLGFNNSYPRQKKGERREGGTGEGEREVRWEKGRG